MAIKLTQKDLKALAAETRIKILKKLQKRKYLQSELAEELNLKPPTVKEHVDSLIKAGFVRKLEEGRKWKYLELTDKSHNLLEPERQSIWIVLSSLGLAIAGGFFAILKTPVFTAKEMMRAESLQMADAAAAPAKTGISTVWIAYYILIVALLALLIYYLLRRRKKLSQLGKYLTK